MLAYRAWLKQCFDSPDVTSGSLSTSGLISWFVNVAASGPLPVTIARIRSTGLNGSFCRTSSNTPGKCSVPVACGRCVTAATLSRLSALLFKTISAQEPLGVLWLEGDFTRFAAIGTRDLIHHALGVALLFRFLAIVRAASRRVRKTFCAVELLFSGGPDKRLAAIAAGEFLVLEISHNNRIDFPR